MRATSPADKAAVLVEALPYIRRFWGQTVVVKYGGNALAAASAAPAAPAPAPAPAGPAGASATPTSAGPACPAGPTTPASATPPGPAGPTTPPGPAGASATRPGPPGDPLAAFATDIVLMRAVGMRLIVVHGGGPQIGELMGRLGMVPRFVDGLRVTDAETLDVARMVLVGKVNRDIVSAINVHGPLAVGVSGEDAGVISAEAKDPELGFVGDVAAVNPDLLLRLVAEDLIPVVATIGSDDQGQAYNINADTAAGAIAAAVGATKLVYLTDVDGIRTDVADPATRISAVSTAELETLIADGTVAGGMIPKVRSCIQAVQGGVGSAHVIDGSATHALLLEIFTDEGVGTMVVRS